MKTRTDFHSVNLSTGERTRSIVGDGERKDEVVGAGKPAERPVPPKYYPLPWHPDEGEPEGAQVYDAHNVPVLMLFWPAHPVEETEAVECETYSLMRLIAELVNRHFTAPARAERPALSEERVRAKVSLIRRFILERSGLTQRAAIDELEDLERALLTQRAETPTIPWTCPDGPMVSIPPAAEPAGDVEQDEIRVCKKHRIYFHQDCDICRLQLADDVQRLRSLAAGRKEGGR